ncbi:MAG: class I SAM-dependent methyltransferase [Rhodothermales bacterium]
MSEQSSDGLGNSVRPTFTSARRWEDGRLVYYLSTPDATYWDLHWKSELTADFYAAAEKGDLSWFEEPFTAYLPRDGTILEAGCGLGQYVRALSVRGYDCEGVEWGSNTVDAAKALLPDLAIRVGDVRHLDVPDGHYNAYISLGVVEHAKEGPGAFLEEASRILSPRGVLLVSVPFVHPLRRLKGKLGLFSDEILDEPFYQYAFMADEMKDILDANGFETVDLYPYDGLKGLKDELPLIRKLLSVNGVGWRLRAWLRRRQWLRRFGHMMLFVCFKK